MLRPVKLLTGLLAFSLFLVTCLLISSYPIPSRSADTLRFCVPSQPSTHQQLQQQQQQQQQKQQHSRSYAPVRVPSKVTRQIKYPAVPGKSTVVSFPPASTPATPIPENPSNKESPSSASSFTATTTFKQVDPQDPRYLMYIPYAGVTNQLISIWHGSLIAKALNRTLLIPNLSPNVHVEVEGQEQEPTPTKWSEFFDLEQYSRLTGLKIEELDTFLARRGIVEKTKRSMASSTTTTTTTASNAGEDNGKRKRSETESVDSSTIAGRKRRLRKRWIQVGSPIQQGHPVAPSSTSSSSSSSSSPSAYTSGSGASSSPSFAPSARSIKFPTVQKCFSEAGYGSDRRIDMTGRRFMQRYNIDPTLIPTPFLDPGRDNDSIWSRWRMDKVIERYQQPQFENQEILCLGHVYRLLPGGHNRAWVEFGQHFRYTDRVHAFVDEILDTLLPLIKDTSSINQESQQQQRQEEEQPRHLQPFVGVHLRRGDFQRHCLGITSPADPNGWNRCYPSTEHIISLFDNYSRQQYQHQLQQYHHQQSLSRASPSTPPKSKKLPVLVLTNERDPVELSKADAQNWIRVDHQQLGTLERFGRYGPILIDGALLARANLLIGVEYSTYFKTASKRAENWYGGRTIFVT